MNFLNKYCNFFGNVFQNVLYLYATEPTTLPIRTAHPGGSSILMEVLAYEI